MSVQCVSPASDSPEQPAELDILPDELLANLLRSTGVNDSLALLPHNSRLHRAWQTAVEHLSIRGSTIDEKDIHIIKKYINLKRLSLSSIRTAGIPAWHVTLEASCLEKLSELSVQGSKEGAGMLKVVASTSLRSRLHVLHLEDYYKVLRTSDLSALGTLTALRSLSLTCQNIHYEDHGEDSFRRLRTACAALQSLKDLYINGTGGALAAPLAAVFPGSLTGLTSLALLCQDSYGLAEEEHALVAAVSGLVNLQQLDTNYALLSAESQAAQQALGQLTRLTTIRAETFRRVDAAAIYLQPQLSLLQELAAADYCVCNPFVLRSLRKLEACGVEVPEAQRGAVLQAWPLQELELYVNSAMAELTELDSQLQGFPSVPSLTTFHVYNLSPSGAPARYLHLANMLDRHAGHLRDIVLHLLGPYLEAFPAALPSCRSLLLLGSSVGMGTLALLRSCAMPALEELHLLLPYISGMQVLATLQRDLGWLAGLPALCSVRVDVGEPGLAELQAALMALLPGKQVPVAEAPSW